MRKKKAKKRLKSKKAIRRKIIRRIRKKAKKKPSRKRTRRIKAKLKILEEIKLERKPDIPARQPAPRKIRKFELKPIEDVARSIGIKKKFLELYGPYKAKLSFEFLKSLNTKKIGKYILVSSITPTPFGEGKTTTALGLSMALNRLNKKSIACIMQPSLGGVLGAKGTGTGSGLAQVFPKEDANFCLTGDIHAVQSAHNLCAAYLDNMIFNGNPLDMDPGSITWKRVTDANDRSLRNINTGLGGKKDGVSRKTGFDAAISSELMAVLSLAENLKDLKERIGRIILGFTKKERPITCADIKVSGAILAILKNTFKPNILQTSENTACLVHGSSSGSLALGTTTTIADKVALSLSDYAVVETAFGTDLGAEKFFDIKCRTNSLKPDVAVIVSSMRALKMHSGDFEVTLTKIPRDLLRENVSSVERGLSNLEKHIENIKTFGVPVIVCINRFSENTEKEIATVKKRAIDFGANTVVVSDAFRSGSEGSIDLAKKVIELSKTKSAFRFLYPLDMSPRDKVKRIAKTVYGAKEVVFSEEANAQAILLKKLKLENLPVCVVKTHLSLSQSPKRKGRPHGFKFPVDELVIRSGAGYIAAVSENMKTLPSLPRTPRGTRVDVDDEGNIVGL